MLEIEITPEEREILGQILETSLTSLDNEIHRTDRLEFKHQLQHRRNVLKGLTDKLLKPMVMQA